MAWPVHSRGWVGVFSVVYQGNACLSVTSSLGVRHGSASVFPQRASSLQRGGKHRRDWRFFFFFFSFWCNTEMGTKCKHAKRPFSPPGKSGLVKTKCQNTFKHGVLLCLGCAGFKTEKKHNDKKTEKKKSGGMVGKERGKKKKKKLKALCSHTSRADGEPNERKKLHQSFKVIVSGKEPAFSACDSTFPYWQASTRTEAYTCTGTWRVFAGY